MSSPGRPPASPPDRTCTCTSPSTSTLQTSTPRRRFSGSSRTSSTATGPVARTPTAATSTLLSSTFHRWGGFWFLAPRLLGQHPGRCLEPAPRPAVGSPVPSLALPSVHTLLSTGNFPRSLGLVPPASPGRWSWNWPPTCFQGCDLCFKPVKDSNHPWRCPVRQPGLKNTVGVD